MPLEEAWEKLNSLTHYEFIQIPIKDVLNVLKLKHGFKDVEKPSIVELNNIKKRNKYLYDSLEAEIIQREKNKKLLVGINLSNLIKAPQPLLIEKQSSTMQPDVSLSKVTEDSLREKIKINTLLLIEKDKEIAQLIFLCKDKDTRFKLMLESQSQYYSQNSSLSADEYNNLIKSHSISQEKLLDTMNLCKKQQEIIKGFIERIKGRLNLLDNNLSTLEIKYNKEIKMQNICNDLNEKLFIISSNIKEKKDEIEALSFKFNNLKKLSEGSKKLKRDYKNKLVNEKKNKS